MQSLLRLARLIDRVNGLFGKLIPWLVFAAVAISALNAVARKAFNLSSNAYLEVQWYLFAAVFLLGGGYAFLVNAHVRIDVLAGKLSMRARNIIDVVGIVLFLLPLCVVMLDLSWPYVWQAYTSGEISQNFGGLIRWPVYALVPVGFALLGLQALSEQTKRLAFLAGQGPNPLHPGSSEEEAVEHGHRGDPHAAGAVPPSTAGLDGADRTAAYQPPSGPAKSDTGAPK